MKIMIICFACRKNKYGVQNTKTYLVKVYEALTQIQTPDTTLTLTRRDQQ
jgi:hypothetical protein